MLKRLLVVLVVFLCLSGCGCSKTETTTNNTEGRVDQVLSGFDGKNIYTLDLDEMVAIGTPAIPYLSAKMSSSDKFERWAVIMSLAAIGRQLNAEDSILSYLMDAFDDEDVSVRVMAAELALAFGENSAIPILIAAMESDEAAKPSEPPIPITSQALAVLQLYTGQTFTEQQEWQDWWDQQ
jgi:hypothetical protein